MDNLLHGLRVLEGMTKGVSGCTVQCDIQMILVPLARLILAMSIWIASSHVDEAKLLSKYQQFRIIVYLCAN